MQSHYIQYPNSTFHYRSYGNGVKLLFCFHGYGRDSSVFHFLENLVGERYTIIAIDLPFHGKTEWDKELTFHPHFLIELMQQIRTEHKKEKDKFWLLGFSLGGRIALQVTQILYRHIDRLILIAPDGLMINSWNYIATHTWAGNKLLSYTVTNPSWFLKVLQLAEKTKIIGKSIAGFVHYYMDDAEQRLVLYQRWTSMRKFFPNLSKIKRHISKHQIKTRLMFGRYDNIIPLAGSEKFITGIENYASLTVVNSGHNLLNEGNVSRILELFND